MGAVTSDAYLIGMASLINVSGVTSLLNGGITKGPKRPDGISYPAINVLSTVNDVGMDSTIQNYNGWFNIFVASEKNGSADMATLSAIETQVLAAANVDRWTQGTTVCKSQFFIGSLGPLWDQLEADVHYLSVRFRSYISL
jgi:hypothetical protein